MNRKFTDEEIEKFYLEKGVKESFKRKWIYNPYVHGDEASFNAKVQELKNRTPVYNKKEVRDKILAENQKKIEAGESVILTPYRIQESVDPSGKKTGLDANPLIHHYKALN